MCKLKLTLEELTNKGSFTYYCSSPELECLKMLKTYRAIYKQKVVLILKVEGISNLADVICERSLG